MQQITNKMRKKAYLLFVDLSSAFDHVERKWLFDTIKQRYKNHKLDPIIKLLESLYAHTTTSLAETPDDTFEITLGVRQGGPESPLLYNLYMDFIMRVLKLPKKRGKVFKVKV